MMDDRLQPYPEYKDSGVHWLGEVPAHWQQLPGRACYREKKIPNTGMQETTVLSLSYGQIVVKPEEKLHGLVPASFETYQIVDPGDIIVRPTDLQNDWNSLRFGLSNYRGIITSAYMCLHTEDGMQREYGHLLLHAYDLKKVFYGLGSGLRQNLDWRDFKYLPCLAPPPDEQAAIVRYLDHMDRRIRRYIRARRRLIALLGEQKQAIIHQAVTRGLDPSVPLKPSGVTAIGMIPENYRRVKLSRICTSIRDGTHNPPPALPGVHRLLSVRNIINGEFVTRNDDRTMTPEAFDELQRSYTVRKGDVVLALVGATTGKSAVVGDMHNVTVQRSIGILRPRQDIVDSQYLNLVLASQIVQSQIRETMDKYAAQPGIYLADVNRLQFVLPDKEIQKKIVLLVQQQTSNLDRGLQNANCEIDLIREYRTRLIADVVTGKVDVRAAAAALPADFDEPGDALDAAEDEDGSLDEDAPEDDGGEEE